MRTYTLRSVAGAGLALWLAVVACGGGSIEPTATPLTRPTQRPKATEDTGPKATKTPTGSASNGELTLADKAFEHDSGAFSINFPEGWEVDAKDNSVFVEAPDKEAAVEVLFTNTGFKLDEEQFDNAIEAIEANWFATFEDYERLEDKAPQEDGSIGVFKTLKLSDGTPQVVWSYYWQRDQALYEVDLWMDEAVYEDYQDFMLEVANSMEFDEGAVAEVGPYQLGYNFNGPDQLFVFYVPYAWRYELSEEGDTVLDKFTSPDQASAIESLVDRSGNITSLEEARAEALQILEQAYGVTEKDVSAEEEQDDGSVRIDWETDDLIGSAFYEVREDKFLFLGWMVQADLYDIYDPVWGQLLDSYGPPAEE